MEAKKRKWMLSGDLSGGLYFTACMSILLGIKRSHGPP